MGVNGTMSPIVRMGETAGAVWRHLDKKGTVSLSQLVEELDMPRDLLMQAIGWLAREDKVVLEEVSRRKLLTLRRS